MRRPQRRADALLAGACLLALAGCAGLQGARHAPPAAGGPAYPAAEPTAAAPATEPSPPPIQEAPAAPAQDAAPVPAPSARTLDLLLLAEAYADQPPEIQRQAVAEAEARNGGEQTPYNLVRYALLLTLTQPDRAAGAKTTTGLRELAARRSADDADGDLVPLAQLLVRVLDEREHLLAQNAELQRKLDQLKAIERTLGAQDGNAAAATLP